MKKETPKLWGSGLLKIYDAEIDTYVLEDGSALIGKTKILKALGRPKKGDSKSDRPEFLSANNLLPFISNELEEKLKGTQFKVGSNVHSAYDADILPLICNVYLEARQAGVLLKQQLPTALQCEILVRSLSRVGIVALIYEHLGFEKYKHPEALKMLVESYLTEEERLYSSEFPDELFRQMDRIYGNERTTSRNRPLYYAKFIRKYIYNPLEKGLVLNELDIRNPVVISKSGKRYRKGHHHTELSERIGLPAVRAQFWQVIGVLKSSSNKRTYESNYAKMMGQSYQGNLFEDKD
jgi:hypothetical protein